jgi:L(+)-tartrate dehydratase alpha subunit
MKDREQCVDIIARFIGCSAKRLPDDVVARLKTLREEEESPAAKLIYDAMFADLDMAAELSRPCCQDTGILQFFIRAGVKFPLLNQMESILREAAIRATREAPLRPNAVEFFDEKNSGDNTGTRIPWIDWEIVPSDVGDAGGIDGPGEEGLDLYLYMAGGGCSLPGFAKTLMPLEGYEGAVKAVFDQVSTYGVNACPPLLAGIGLGGSVDVAAKLSKKALLRFIGTRNPNPKGALLERQIEEGLNGIGLGPGGLSGKRSVMAVHIEQAARHTATVAVALSTGCWAHRRSLIRFDKNLDWQFLSHRGGAL